MDYLMFITCVMGAGMVCFIFLIARCIKEMNNEKNRQAIRLLEYEEVRQ